METIQKENSSFLVRINQKMSTPLGYFHTGLLTGALMSIIWDASALECVGGMVFCGLMFGLVGYLKKKFFTNEL